MSIVGSGQGARRAFSPIMILVIGSLLTVGIVPYGARAALGERPSQRLLISEVVTGGSNASDELIEIYNPGPDALPLEGLELIYASASGLTVSRRAAWGLGAPVVPPRHHVLVANELGAYASIADAHYASGIAAAGGSVALRIQGAETAIDAVGWGSAANAWMEGAPATAPAPGSSIERLPGGAFGSTRDTDDNASDFAERLLPDPQNTGSAPTPDPAQPPPTVAPTPSPVPSPSATSEPSGTATPTATAGPAPMPIGTARSLPSGMTVTIEGTTLTDAAFTDGGGYVADSSGGIAVLLADGSFERGARLRVTGTVDDRFSQRTIRTTAGQIVALGPGPEPAPVVRATGDVGEAVEGTLVRIAGTIAGSPTSLSAGLAYEVNDGTGAARVIVASSTGIDTAPWTSGTRIEVVGVVGQRDSTGTGSSGYRVQPRDPVDVLGVGRPVASASPSPGAGSGPPGASPSPSPAGVVPIADARAAVKNARIRVRGVVTLPSGVVDAESAVIQDDSGAILLRLGGEVGPLRRGERIEVDGTRSTKSGMETLRVTQPPLRLGTVTGPDPRPMRTGEVGEDDEAALLLVRGALVAAARRASSGTAWFEVDDGSGPLRVLLGASLGADPSAYESGTWLEIRGVLGQETTGAQPTRGYRLWPPALDEVRVLAGSPGPGRGADVADAGASDLDHADGGAGAAPPVSLAGVGGADLSELRVGATLVNGPWKELSVGGLLWDGERLVAIDGASADRVAAVLGAARPPLALELGGLRAVGLEPTTSVAVVALGDEPADVSAADAPPADPATTLEALVAPRWVSVVGRIATGAEPTLVVGEAEVRLDLRCATATSQPSGAVQVTGIAVAPSSVIVPCLGMRPAPVVERRVVANPPLRLAGAHATPDSTRPDGTGRPVAALLLAVGAILLLGAAALRYRLEGSTASAVTEAPIVQDEEASDPSSPPSLTLVTVPHEHGSR